MSKLLINLGASLILLSIAVRLLLKITDNNNTISILYKSNSPEWILRKFLEKTKSTLSVFAFIIGVVFIMIAIFD